MRKLILAGLALLLGAGISWAAIAGTPFANITSTATTTDWTTSGPATTVCVANGPKADQTASANEVYVQVYACGETIAAATTSSPIVIHPGEGWVCMSHNPRTEVGQGYCGMSAITANTETATLRYFRK